MLRAFGESFRFRIDADACLRGFDLEGREGDGGALRPPLFRVDGESDRCEAGCGSQAVRGALSGGSVSASDSRRPLREGVIGLRLQRSQCPRPRVLAHARLPRRMAHEEEAGPRPLRRRRPGSSAGAARLAGRADQALALGTRTVEGIQAPGYQSGENVPGSWQESTNRFADKEILSFCAVKFSLGASPNQRIAVCRRGCRPTESCQRD